MAAWSPFAAAAGLAIWGAMYIVGRHGAIDFDIYARCSGLFFQDVRPFDNPAFRRACFYPPAWYLLTEHVFLDPTPAVRLLWRMMVLLATLTSFLLPLGFLERRARPWESLVPVTWALWAATSVFTDSIATANVSAIVAVLVMAALLALHRGPAWARFPAGAAVGLAAVIKLHPIILVAYLLSVWLVRSDARARDAGLVALALFGAAQAAPMSGDFWAFILSSDGLAGSLAARGSNGSIAALLFRLNVTVHPLLLLAALSLPIVVLLARRRMPLPIEASLVLVVQTLASPAVWAHSLTLLTLPFLLAVEEVANRIVASNTMRDSRPRAVLAALVLAACWLVCLNHGDFSMRLDTISTFGTALAVAMPVAIGVLVALRGMSCPDSGCWSNDAAT